MIKEKEPKVEEKEEPNKAKVEELEMQPEHIQEGIKEDLETLIQAMDIMKDSARMKKVKEYAEVKKGKINSLADLQAEALKIPSGEDKIV